MFTIIVSQRIAQTALRVARADARSTPPFAVFRQSGIFGLCR